MEVLERALENNKYDVQDRQNIKVVLAYAQGKKVNEITQSLGVSKSTIYRLVDKFIDGGVEELIGIYSGRPSSLTINQKQHIEKVINQSPTEQGYYFAEWSGEILKHYIGNKYGIDYSIRNCQIFLNKNKRFKFDIIEKLLQVQGMEDTEVWVIRTVNAWRDRGDVVDLINGKKHVVLYLMGLLKEKKVVVFKRRHNDVATCREILGILEDMYLQEQRNLIIVPKNNIFQQAIWNLEREETKIYEVCFISTQDDVEVDCEEYGSILDNYEAFCEAVKDIQEQFDDAMKEEYQKFKAMKHEGTLLKDKKEPHLSSYFIKQLIQKMMEIELEWTVIQ